MMMDGCDRVLCVCIHTYMPKYEYNAGECMRSIVLFNHFCSA